MLVKHGMWVTRLQSHPMLNTRVVILAKKQMICFPQILSLCSDPLASVERQRSCTLTQAAQESLSVSSESRPNGGSGVFFNILFNYTVLLLTKQSYEHLCLLIITH